MLSLRKSISGFAQVARCFPGIPSVRLVRYLHDPVQPPVNVWRPDLSEQDRQKLCEIYSERKRQRFAVQNKIVPPPATITTTTNTAVELSESTRECLRLIRDEANEQNHIDNKLYAIIELNTKPYCVTKNDIVITKHLPQTKAGDRLQLSNLRELGSRSYYIRGSPLIDHRYFHAEAVVLENRRTAKYTKYLKRPGKGGGDRKWRKRSYRDNLTILRITDISIPPSI